MFVIKRFVFAKISVEVFETSAGQFLTRRRFLAEPSVSALARSRCGFFSFNRGVADDFAEMRVRRCVVGTETLVTTRNGYAQMRTDSCETGIVESRVVSERMVHFDTG